jgi:hypothetical protein
MAYVRGIFARVTLVATFTVQDPALQVLYILHVCPQLPQLDGSEAKLMHVPLQQPRRGPAGHFVPHAPQLSPLVVRFTQVLPQFVSPKITQLTVRPPGLTRVRPVPTEDVVIEVVVPVVTAVVVTDVVGAVVASVAAFVQVDALHIILAGHTFPHWPQLAALEFSS